MNAWSSNEGNSNHWNDRTGTDGNAIKTIKIATTN